MADKSTVAFRLNGRDVSLETRPFRRLLDVIREDFELTGSKEGCGEGECGACSVFLNGELVNSCIIPVLQAEGAEVTTIEAAADRPLGAAVQRAFCDHGGAQCGICTPGMIMAATWVMEHRAELPAGGLDQGITLRDLLAGNLCRCTGYDLIVKSVEEAIKNAGASTGGGS